MKILVVTTLLPDLRRSGGEILTQGVIDALRTAGHRVHVIGYRRRGDRTPPQPGATCVGARRIETRGAGTRALGWMLGAVATRAPYTTAKWRSRAYRRTVLSALGQRPDALIVDHARTHSVIPAVARIPAPVIHVAHNAESELYASLAAAAPDRARRLAYRREARAIRRVESELAASARQVWALTERDRTYFRSLHGRADVRVLPVAAGIPEAAGTSPASYDVATIGSWSWDANRSGLEWFSAEVMPHLPAATTVAVAGRGADWLRGRHPNVAVHGIVPDASEFLARARVVAVPVVAGSGVQLKLLDAIAAGRPVVATPRAAAAVGRLPRSVSVTGDPVEFAQHLRRLAAEPHDDRREALDWSRDRRRRFEAAVADWVGELGT